MGGRLRRLLRSDDLVVRVGGDEFVLVVRDTTVDDAALIARRVIEAIQRPCAVDGKLGLASVAVGASIGVCVRADDMPFDEATRLADEALGTAKHLGKGRYVVSHDDGRTMARERPNRPVTCAGGSVSTLATCASR